MRRLAVDAHHLWRQRYRPTNTEYVWGRRRDPFGSVSFPPEMTQLERMIAARERAIAAAPPSHPAALLDRMARSAAAAEAADGPTLWELAPSAGRLPEDDWTPPAVEARGTETSLGSTTIASPEATIAESLTVADGYVVECFASEAEVPELANPLAATFDDRGRLWVLCAPTYPHPLPGTPPASRLIILEDTDGDGRADACATWADGLSTPTGFAIAGDGTVYFGEAPDLLRLRDTDGDGRADRREIVASGFGMPDSHHQISAFEWAPDGGLLLHEGVFTVSAVETPWGTLRTRDAAVWRFDPRTQRLTVCSHASFANPWGHAFDDWGASVLADASGGDSFAFSHVTTAFTWPDKPRRPGAFLNRGRPTAGAEMIAGRHFPEDVQDTILVNQSIGFHGTRWDRVVSEPGTSGFRAERMPQDLLASRDVNVRPVALEIGPDGTLVIVDWCNPIIGHMQYSLRDPRRDASHGRIWRVRHAERPLVEPPDVAGADVPALLEVLRLPERNTRGLARRRLQAADPAVVLPAARTWAAAMQARHATAADPLHDRLLVELMWLHEAHGDGRLDVLDDVLELLEPRGRAAGARSIRRRLQAGTMDPDDAAALLERLAVDADMRVRLEAVVACGFLPAARGEAIAVRAADRPMDGPMFTVLEATLAELGRGRAATSDLVRRLRLLRAPAETVLAETLDDVVASVRLARADLPAAARAAALDRLAAGGAAADPPGLADEPRRVAVLLAELDRARLGTTAEGVGDLLLDRAPAALAAPGASARLARLAEDPRSAVSAAAAAALLRAGDAERTDALSDAALLAGLRRLPAARPDDPRLAAPLARVRRDVALGRLPAADALGAVLRHAGPDAASRAPVVAWLGRLIEAGGRLGLDAWGPRHDVAMAALAALHRLPAGEWPAALRLARQPAPADAVLERGRAIYHDEIVGCLRCHGADGRGLEGYPPLVGSPRLVGDPRVAAGIVVHGLYGPLRTPDGRRFDSVMAPLGASLDDAEVAAVLTWVRRAWGNFAPPVDARTVAAARAARPPGGTMWTVADLDRRWPAGLVTLLGPRTAVATDTTAPGPAPAATTGPPAAGSASSSPATESAAGPSTSGTPDAPATPDAGRSPDPSAGDPGPGTGMLLLLLVGGVVVVAILAARSRRSAA